MSLVLITGTIATLSHEIDWLLNKDMRVTPGEQRVSWGEMELAVKKYSPDDSVTALMAMEGDHFAFRARTVAPSGRHSFVHVNQWTGEVTGQSSTLTVQRFFRDIHRYLFMPNYIGLPIVTSLAFVLAVSLYTGLKITRKWKLMASRVRTRRGIRVAIGDAHKAVGLWSSWFLLLMIITGIWYLVEFSIALTLYLSKPDSAQLSENTLASTGTSALQYANADLLVASAREAFPDLTPTIIYFSRGAAKPAQVQGRLSNPLLRDRANKVLLNPVNAEVVAVQRASQTSWFVYLNEMADPLHFGYFGGLTTKLIWFIFGLGLSGLSISGLWLTWRRLESRSPSRAQYATVPILLGMLVAGVFWYEKFVGPSTPPPQKSTAHDKLAAVDHHKRFTIRVNGK